MQQNAIVTRIKISYENHLFGIQNSAYLLKGTEDPCKYTEMQIICTLHVICLNE